MKLEEAIKQVKPVSREAAEASRKRWDGIAKPLNGLGVLEEDISRIAAVQRSAEVSLEGKAIAVMCADNGIVEEGVTQTGQEVTSIVAGNMGTGQSCVCLMAACAGARVIPVDVGMAGEQNLPGVLDRRVAAGTRNFRKEPAMTREQAVQALEAGIWTAELFAEQGIRLAGSGEMGIGNTTTSSAVASVMLKLPPEEVTGRGAGGWILYWLRRPSDPGGAGRADLLQRSSSGGGALSPGKGLSAGLPCPGGAGGESGIKVPGIKAGNLCRSLPGRGNRGGSSVPPAGYGGAGLPDYELF